MTTARKPFSLVYDLETTRPGEQVHAAPDPIGDDLARRLRDVERAGRLRLRLTAARTEALEMARHHRYRRRDEPAARACETAADAYQRWYFKVVRFRARARGEAIDG